MLPVLSTRSRFRARFLSVGLMALSFGLSNVFGAQVYDGRKQPHILFIVADDLAEWAVGAYHKPNSHTPHIDRLAGEGMVFENAFSVSAVCSPARAALLTGLYPSETGVVDVLPSGEPYLSEKLWTWPQMLQLAGYRTALIGSWEMGQGRDIDMPTQRGFDEFSGLLQVGVFSREPVVDFLAPGKTRRSDLTSVNYDDIPGEQYTDEILADLTIDFMRRSAASDKPFFVSLNFGAPHANTRFPRGFRPPYNDRSWLPLREDDLAWWRGLRDDQLILPELGFPNLDSRRLLRMMREYHASVHNIDRNVGRLLAFLQDPNGDGVGDDSIAENTLIVFTSDHGYMLGHHGLWHKGNGRWLTLDRRDPAEPRLYGDDEGRANLFDRSIRVPFIVRWPARLSPGGRETGVITHLDWFPTVAAIAQAPLRDTQPVRGTAIAALTGQKSRRGQGVFAQYRELRMMRSEGWKLVRHLGHPERDELYNLERDPDEKVDMSDDSDETTQAALARLGRELRSHMETIRDPLISALP